MGNNRNDAVKSTLSHPSIVETNREFFRDNDRYLQLVSDLDTYAYARQAIDGEIAGAKRLLDVGNGGVFDYDTGLVESIVAVDLFLDELPAEVFPANVEARTGDATDLDADLRDFDVVLLVMLLHHLTGRQPKDVEDRIRQALAAASAALGRKGRLVIVESCVPRWFYSFEKLAFPVLRQVSEMRMIKHPATLQVSHQRLLELVLEQYRVERFEPIPMGRYLLQFGHKWPTVLTPARHWLVVGVPR